MIWIASAFLAISHPSSFMDELIAKNGGPCPNCTQIPSDPDSSDLMIFMSLSVPLESWKDLSSQLEQTGGRFLLRGFPDDSMERLAEKILELKADGIHAPIDIDPDAFEWYGIDIVPAIVLANEKRFDRIFGNIRLDAAMRIFAEQGDVPMKAKEILSFLGSMP